MALPDQPTFIFECRAVVGALGREDEKIAARAHVAWGFNQVGARCYVDKVVEIVAEADPSKRILVTKLDTKNPVLCTDKAGLPYRWHGEATRARTHVHILYLGLADE